MGNFDDFKEIYTDSFSLKLAVTGHLPNDPPLLQELGIDLSLIKIESQLPFRVLRNNSFHKSSSTDLTGPIIFLIFFMFILMLNGKAHFGYIYLISLSASSFIYALLSLISQNGTNLTVCCSVMGYSLTPILFFAVLNLVLRWAGLYFRVFLGIGFSLWSAYTASNVLCRCYDLGSKTIILGYPLILSYICFILMILF